MLKFFAQKTVLVSTAFFMSIMFIIVMFFVNPLIDSGHGLSVISLQLSFDKNIGLKILDAWGDKGITNFKQWIFTDYIYAISYSLFFASFLSFLIVKKGKEKSSSYRRLIYLAFIAGLFDCIENTMQLFFVNNPIHYSESLFFIHSIISSVKWIALPTLLIAIGMLLSQKNSSKRH